MCLVTDLSLAQHIDKAILVSCDSNLQMLFLNANNIEYLSAYNDWFICGILTKEERLVCESKISTCVFANILEHLSFVFKLIRYREFKKNLKLITPFSIVSLPWIFKVRKTYNVLFYKCDLFAHAVYMSVRGIKRHDTTRIATRWLIG